MCLEKEEEREAVSIILGGANSDYNNFSTTVARQKAFSFHVIQKSLTIQVENAEASVEDDKIHILNSIVGNTGTALNDTPPKCHEKYVELNDALRGTFASTEPVLEHAAKGDDETWMKIMKALSKATTRGMKFDFSIPWLRNLTAAQSTTLVCHLPLTIEKLDIYKARLRVEFMDAIIERIKQVPNLKDLSLWCTHIGDDHEGQVAGLRLAEILKSNTTIEIVDLRYTNLIGSETVTQWGDALLENTSLTYLLLNNEQIGK